MKNRPSTRTLALGLLLAASMQAQSAVTDLATAPLITDPTAAVLPNVFLLLDDSGTMGFDFMPRAAGDFEAGEYGIAASQCNGVYYNPAIRYYPPVDSSGTDFTPSSFNAAWIDGFNPVATVNLGTSFVDATPPRAADGAQTAFYYVYSGTLNTDAERDFSKPAGTFYQQCNSLVGAAPGNDVFTKVVIDAASAPFTKGISRTDCAGANCTFAEESQNFANWYSYYRTRMQTMKTAAGRAFRAIGNNFRVGYASINNNTNSDFVALDSFDAAQKLEWYTKLYHATPDNNSPLREALAKVGSMYAAKLANFNGTAVVDPIQYSCQQNFTILTSDGSWNFGAGFDLDGNLVGNQDGDEPRPYFDGAYREKTTSHTERTDTNLLKTTSEDQQWTQQNQSRTSDLQSSAGPLQWSTKQQYKDSTLNWTTDLQATTNTLQWQTDLQATTNTLQWQTDLQHTDATLQWQTDLQATTNTLQWQTDLQHTDAPLQWQTDLQQTIQQQLWSTDQQQTTAPLQWQTKQQVTTAPLLWATKSQKTTAALQWATNQQRTTAPLLWTTTSQKATAKLQWRTNLQATSGTLQQRTSQLQHKIRQLQHRTSTLQEQISQLQSRTSTLQSSTMYLQRRVNGGAWNDVAACTWFNQDGTVHECRYVTAASGTTVWSAGAGIWNAAGGNCTASYGTITTHLTTWSGNGNNCRYYDAVGGVGGWSNWTDTSSCTPLAQSAGPNYTVNPATQCRTVVDTAFHNVASCTTDATPDGTGKTTQCQYTGWSGWSGISACTPVVQDGSSPFDVGTATQCQTVTTTDWTTAGGACTVNATPDGSGNTTDCRYNSANGVGTFSNWANVISDTCTPAAQSSGPNYATVLAEECRLTGSSTDYVTTNPAACAVTYNNPGTSSSDGSGKSISACSKNVGSYSTFANVGNNKWCTTVSGTGPAGSSTECQMSAATPAYLAFGATCSDTYNAGGASHANGSGNVTDCSTNASFNPAKTTLTNGQSCNTSTTVQCSTGTENTDYTTYASPACATTYNAGGNSTAASNYGVNNTVVTACTVSGSFSTPVNVGGGNSCNTSAHVQCSMAAAAPAYLAYNETCDDSYNAGGNSTASGGNVTDCSPAGAFGPTTPLTNGQACTDGATVQCSLGSETPIYTTHGNPGCATTYTAGTGGTAATNHGVANTVVSACSVSGSWSDVTALTAGQTCTVSATVQCPVDVGAATSAYVNYAMASGETCPASINYHNGFGETSIAGAGGNVVTDCPTAAWSTPVAGACDDVPDLLHVQCSLDTAVTNWVTTYPPTCTEGTSGGGLITTCTLAGSFSPVQNIGANNTCTGGTRAAGTPTWGNTVQCVTGTALVPAYVANYPPTCTINYSGDVNGTYIANASGNVITDCPTAAFGGTTAIGAGNTCDGTSPNVKCIATAGAATNRVTNYPPTCGINFDAATGGTADGSGKVITNCTTPSGFGGGGDVSALPGPYTNICDGTLDNVKCIATAGAATAYVANYPPTCATTFNGNFASTTAVAGKVITACPTAAFGGGGAVGAGNTCDVSNLHVNCAIAGGVATTVTTYPPTCTPTYVNETTSATADASGNVRTCPIAAGFGGWTNTTVANASCTPSATVDCRYNWGGWSAGPEASCTDNFDAESAGVPMTNLNGTRCQYSAWTAYSDYAGAVCPAVAKTAASPYVVGTARECQKVNIPNAPSAWPAQAWVGVPGSSCTPTAPVTCALGTTAGCTFDGTGKNVQCKTATTGPSPAASCTAGTLGIPPYTTTTCVTNTVVAAHGVASCTPGTGGAPNYITTACATTITALGPFAGCVVEGANAGNNWTSTTCSAPSGGTVDTLADVAEYYYRTDLRTVALSNDTSGALGTVNGTDISLNNVPITAEDTASHQHMTTFTVGLGVRGMMAFDPLYKTSVSGDYFSVANGSLADGSGICSWQGANSTCDWPSPAADTDADIDDLWHAAVDGRGTYFSAKNPSDLSVGLISALANIQTRLGSAAAATTSTAFVTEGDNFLFRSSYLSLNWTGELTRQQLNTTTGAIEAAIDWSAQAKLDANASRKIYTYDPGVGDNLKLFTFANLTATEKGYFDLTALPKLAQFSIVCPTDLTCLSAADEAAASGANLVNYIAGTRTNEGNKLDATKYYRQRANLLGDIVDSESVYIKKPIASFSDPGYGSFKTDQSGRRAMVYVGANDGMLHAFRAEDDAVTPSDEGGQEDWAYIPRIVMPELYKLADKHYENKHQFYVDGSPVTADICTSLCTDNANAVWKTILVGGLNHGGKGYYALDVTDPANPQALWEFTDANMGFSYGNPKVVKLADGTWVVLVTSGYNNTTGDGEGHLYVLNAVTGAVIRDMSTGVGTAASPSGLARIDAPVRTPGIDATAIAVYGGDLEGNLWRFDINDNVGAAGYDVQLLATLRDATNVVQPITAKPLITVVSGIIVVNVGTGRYLGATDQNNPSYDSFYAIKDTFPAAATPSVAIYDNPRTTGTFVEQTQTAVPCPVGTPVSVCATGEIVYISSNHVVNFNTNAGWFVDFTQVGERVNTDPAIIKGTLVVATNVPSSSSCSVGGDSFLYQLDYRTGGAVSTAPNGIVGLLLGHELTSRPVVAMLQSGKTLSYTQGSGGHEPQVSPVFDNASADGVARRISWRELIVK